MEYFGSRLVWAPLTNIIQPDTLVSDDSSDDEQTERQNDHQSSTSNAPSTISSALDALPNDMAYSQ